MPSIRFRMPAYHDGRMIRTSGCLTQMAVGTLAGAALLHCSRASSHGSSSASADSADDDAAEAHAADASTEADSAAAAAETSSEPADSDVPGLNDGQFSLM
jgi:hypothetical protein